MRDARSILVLLVALVFGLSFAVPADDLPETPYDESELLPFESTPLFASAMQALVKPRSAFDKVFRAKQLKLVRQQTVQADVRRSVSLVILDNSLRC